MQAHTCLKRESTRNTEKSWKLYKWQFKWYQSIVQCY